jgi:hypothetical protein
VHIKIYVSRKAKTTNNLKRREYPASELTAGSLGTAGMCRLYFRWLYVTDYMNVKHEYLLRLFSFSCNQLCYVDISHACNHRVRPTYMCFFLCSTQTKKKDVITELSFWTGNLLVVPLVFILKKKHWNNCFLRFLMKSDISVIYSQMIFCFLFNELLEV